MKLKPLLALTAAALIFTSCSGLELQDYPFEPCAKLPGEKTVTVIKDRCSFCHKGDFPTKELICSRKDLIIETVKSGRMPKFKKLTEEELATILKWEL